MRHTPLGLLLLAASEAAPSFWRLQHAHLVSEPECEVADECSEPWEVPTSLHVHRTWPELQPGGRLPARR